MWRRDFVYLGVFRPESTGTLEIPRQKPRVRGRILPLDGLRLAAPRRAATARLAGRLARRPAGGGRKGPLNAPTRRRARQAGTDGNGICVDFDFACRADVGDGIAYRVSARQATVAALLVLQWVSVRCSRSSS